MGHGLFSSTPDLYDAVTGVWTPTGSMVFQRQLVRAVILPSGQVLVVGGVPGNPNGPGVAELYDPATGVWTPTGSLAAARFSHTATLLPSGEVLVAGGYDSNRQTLDTVEISTP
jgi:hypothetical protein